MLDNPVGTACGYARPGRRCRCDADIQSQNNT
jgi:hypothetical protein